MPTPTSRRWKPSSPSAVEFMEKQHTEILSEPHRYLMVVGVEPSARGRGLGDALIAPGLEQAEQQRLPCYLETFSAKNVQYYQRRGFELMRESIAPDSKLTCWAMVRSAR